MGTAVVEWVHKNGVTVILIKDENVVGTTIGLDGESASKVTVGWPVDWWGSMIAV